MFEACIETQPMFYKSQSKFRAIISDRFHPKCCLEIFMEFCVIGQEQYLPTDYYVAYSLWNIIHLDPHN